MNDILFLAVFILAAAVIVSCICRVNRMNSSKDDKFSWVAAYTIYAATAASVIMHMIERIDAQVLDALSTGELLALAGMAMNLWLTRRNWAHGVPTVVKKDTP